MSEIKTYNWSQRKTRPRARGDAGPSMAEYETWLDSLGVPDDDKRSNGGRIPDHARYGFWLRKNDPIAFRVGYNEWRTQA